MRTSRPVGIDLGTSNTLIYVKGEGIVLFEPSVVAMNLDSKKVLAVGNRAKEMLGRTPGNIVAVSPLKEGVIADFDIAEQMMRLFLARSGCRKFWTHPEFVIAVPSGITGVEKRAVVDSGEKAGASAVYLVEEPMAAAIGAGLPVGDPGGNMIVDIGGGSTEIAVISCGGIVHSRAIRVAGNEMNEAIVQYVKKSYDLLIGERTAEEIKINVGSACASEEENSMQTKGRDLVCGLPKTITITSAEVREALSETVSAIVETIRDALERTPPELSADLIDRGIYLSGGGALLRGMDKLIETATETTVRVVEEPLASVVMGTGKILDEMETLQGILTPGKNTY